MDKEYSKREIDSQMKALHEKMDLVLIQTTKHNGRMSKLESWQSFIKGGLSVLTIMVLPIFLFIVYAVISGKFK